MNINYSMEVACSPEKLWPYLEDPELQKQWMKGLLETVSTSEDSGRIGSTFRMKIQEGGRVAEYEGEVTDFQKNRRLGVRLWGGNFKDGMSVQVDYRLEDLLGRTQLDYTCRLEAPRMGFFMRLLMPLFMCFGRMQVKGFMRKLKSLAETELMMNARV